MKWFFKGLIAVLAPPKFQEVAILASKKKNYKIVH